MKLGQSVVFRRLPCRQSACSPPSPLTLFQVSIASSIHHIVLFRRGQAVVRPSFINRSHRIRSFLTN